MAANMKNHLSNHFSVCWQSIYEAMLAAAKAKQAKDIELKKLNS